jgi:uncharacterized damage-inducible protein DinB
MTPLKPSTHLTPLAHLWHYNSALLLQAITMIERLQVQAAPNFVYAQAVGPHVRHIIEHYEALLRHLDTATSTSVDYDARERDMAVQSQPDVTKAKLRAVATRLDSLSHQAAWQLDTPLQTCLQTGAQGELQMMVPTSLGRELLFLSSHTVHHFALLGHYCKAAGVDLGHDFGKAPSTLAFERKAA